MRRIRCFILKKTKKSAEQREILGLDAASLVIENGRLRWFEQ